MLQMAKGRERSTPKVVFRLAGEAEPFFNKEVSVNNWLKIEWYELSEGYYPEEAGRLICLPFSNNSISLQMAFTIENTAGRFMIVVILMHPEYLAQWPEHVLQKEPVFSFNHTAEHDIRLDSGIRQLVLAFQDSGNDPDFQQSLILSENTLHLLRRVTAQIKVAFRPCVVPACRFLDNEKEREKIFAARTILDTQFDQRITIKDLARKVAINECYLKKGFRTLVGKTVHEYISEKRIASARQMLEIDRKPVNEVADLLGYSSISHFSSAFKKATGIKPFSLIS